MKVFVTGATRLVGFNLVKTLLKRGDSVHALVREQSPNIIDLKQLGAEIFKGDLRVLLQKKSSLVIFAALI